ncbi:MAG: transcriptional repressor [Eubacteriales bacterium]|nr:transcriptional repressor [Eubacteriales bacterium]
MTKKGLIIWNILKEAHTSCMHLTAEEIFLRAKKETPGIAMATVYNNLNLLESEGKIRRIKRGDGPDYFDGNTDIHDHIVCDRCGQISDITLKDFAKDLEQRLGIVITGYDLNVHYVCEACQKKELSEQKKGGTENE